MSGSGRHGDVDSLFLAASGALDAGQERRMAEHLRDCGTCAEELAALQELTSGLAGLATPMPPAALVERVRRVVHLDLAARADERLNRLVLVFLLVFSWTLTLLGFVGVRLLSGASGAIFNLIEGPHLSWSIGYFGAAWLGGALALILIGLYRRKSRSTV